MLRTANPDIYDLMQDVILGIEFKAGALACGILEEKKWDKEEISIDGHNYVVAGYSDIRGVLNKYRYVKQIDNPITAYYYQKHSNHWYFEYTIKHSYSYENHNDIKIYDAHIEEAYKTYFEEQELVKQIVSATNEQDIIPIINTIENIAKKDSINHTPGFFPLLISSINKKISNGDLDINLYNKWFHAYRILLRVLRNYIQTYNYFIIVFIHIEKRPIIGHTQIIITKLSEIQSIHKNLIPILRTTLFETNLSFLHHINIIPLTYNIWKISSLNSTINGMKYRRSE